MANTQPTFLRRFEVFARISNGKSAVILEPVQITLGFTGPVDKESGMVLNLVDVDAWIRSFKSATESKTYANRWALCRLVAAKFESLIERKEFSQIHFKFHNLEVIGKGDEKFLKWHQHSMLIQEKLKWLSPVALQMKSKTKKWPTVNSATEAKIIKSLKGVRLNKLKWAVPGLVFDSFEYTDPKLNIGIILK